MISQSFEKRLSLSNLQVDRLAQLLLLAVTVLTYNVIAMAIANSLFVTHVGAGNLPIAFILIGLCSLPAYGVFSQIADRYRRTQLFRYVLLISMVAMIGMRLLINLDTTWVYYALLIVIFFQWDFNNNLLYPGLLTDYFTTLEYKQYAPFIGIAQAVGTLVGGGFTILLSRYFPSRELLLGLPIFMAIAFFQLLYLESSQRRLETPKQEAEVSILESIKTLPDLCQRYPLVLFLAGSTFLLVIIYISSEFLWFNIYGEHFEESKLTAFLGLMRIIISLIQVLFLYGITRPLLKWIGVARLNAVYPVTTLISLIGLLFNFNLTAAIGLHINGDAFYKAINLPIHQLNYNGIPHQYLGRIRALSDGLIYSVGLTLAGVILWICHLYLSLGQITGLAISLTVLLLFVRIPMGKFYTQSLEEMIRTDSINLDDFENNKTQLPPQSSKVVREFLTDGDRYTQVKGLELATNLNDPSQFFHEAIALLPDANRSLREGVLQLFSQSNQEILDKFANLLTDLDFTVRATALEVLIANQYDFNAEQLQRSIGDKHPEVKTLGLIATFQHTESDKIDNKIAEQFWQTEITDNIGKAIARVVRYSQNPEFITLIEYLLPQATTEAKQNALEALANLAKPQDSHLAKIAVAEINHDEPLIRVAGYKLLEITHCRETLESVTTGMGDAHPHVRQQVAHTIAAYGKSGLKIAQDNLDSRNSNIVNTAIAAIAKVKTKRANEILYKHLAPEFQQFNRTRKWQQQIPRQDPSWRLLAIAIEDYQQRLLQKVLYILSCLGYSRTVNLVRRILATSDRRDLANAVEVLASIEHRRFVQPLMPLLEQIVSDKPLPKIESTPQWLRNKGYKILLEALESGDRWIKTGASVALAIVPTALLKDPDPIVQSVAREIFPAPDRLDCPVSNSMNRLLLLRNIALFKNLSLDELFQIDEALEQRQVLAGETIYTEGSWGNNLYIIAEGRIQIVKELDGELENIKQLATGQYFGEIALFDEAPRWDGAIALEDCLLLSLEKKRFISLISQRPHIILEICRFLSMRLRETDKYMSAKKKP
ncbi:cyclic nucleotide-binding domain-containing protein [Waterburya agarophytonicola K14]|uniref:Cyclic nucleotide-binding domain-containing protein n=1 Tax=Waterburya agarophytonicola KI4 TaxID=2874699 RepID=A0A964BQ87_9CYAN|nr:cyclic nucleotide-binding domain-containing protein [Waterburya agarophytonicola]MCC0176857.1 cyclic nucleotide-binding domain-containing protein [Waterburya agarophytonicola KI4]